MRIIVSLSVFVLFFLKVSLGINPPSGIGSGNNIILWLSPDTGVLNSSLAPASIGQDVAQWLDISGNGFVFTNTFAARRPVLDTLNGQRYLNFTPGDFFENTIIKDSINGLSEFSIFMTIKSDVTNTDNGFMDSEDPNNTDDKICLRYDAVGANTNRSNCLKTGMNGNTAANQVETSANTQTTNLQVLTLVWKDGERLKVYIDGVLNDSSSANVAGPLAGINKIILGKGPKNTAGGLGGGSGWDGLIGEVLFYNKSYSQDTIQIVASEISSVTSAQSGVWSNPSTWDCNCVPKSTYDVSIESGHSITLDSNVNVKSLYIKSGASFDLTSNNFNLGLTRHLNVLGNFIYRQGGVTFNGSQASLITGTFTLHDLIVNKTGASVIGQSGLLTIENEIRVLSGNFDPQGKVVLQSNSSLTAWLGNINGTISSDLKIRLYLNNLSSFIGWRYFSLPIQNGMISSIHKNTTSNSDGLITWGFPGSTFPNYTRTISTFSFDEQAAVSNNDWGAGYKVPSSASDAFNYSNAMAFYCGGPSHPTHSIEVTGIPNYGNQTINNLSYSSTDQSIGGGWHLIGNPYAASVDWSQVAAVSSGIDNIGYVRSNQSNGWIATNLLPTANVIAAFQGMFIHVNSATNSVAFQESHKTSTSVDFLKSKTRTSRLRMSLNSKNDLQKSLAGIFVNENSTIGFDADYDAYNLNENSGVVSMFMIHDTLQLQVNTIPEKEFELGISVYVESPIDDSLVFTVDELPEARGCLRMLDLVTHEFVNLKENMRYTFWQTKTTHPFERFMVFSYNTLGNIETEDVSCYGKVNGKVEAGVKGLSSALYLTHNMVDTLVITNQENLKMTHLGPGYYELVWGGVDSSCGVQKEAFIITEPKEIKSEFQQRPSVFVNEVIELKNNSLNADTYFWSFGNGASSVGNEPTYSYGEEGDYKITLVASYGACSDTMSKLVTVRSQIELGLEQSKTDFIQVYTSKGKLIISNPELLGQLVTMYSPLGQLVLSGNIAEDLISLDLPELSTGLYTVNVQDDQGTVLKSERLFISADR